MGDGVGEVGIVWDGFICFLKALAFIFFGLESLA